MPQWGLHAPPPPPQGSGVMGHNTPPPVIPAPGGAYAGEGATTGENPNPLHDFVNEFLLMEVVVTTSTTPICDGLSFSLLEGVIML